MKKKLIETLNEIHEKNSFSTRKHFNIEKINLLKFGMDSIEYGKKTKKINNKEIIIKAGEILLEFIPQFIKENIFNLSYKKSIKKVLKDTNSIVKILTYQDLIQYTTYSIDVFINGIKIDISRLQFIFNTNYHLYIKLPNSVEIQNIYIFEKKVKSHLRYIKRIPNNIPNPYSTSNDYMLFINGLNKTTYTPDDNSLISSANAGDIVEIIKLDQSFERQDIPANMEYSYINSSYELDESSILIFSSYDGKLLNINTELKTKNIIYFNDLIDIDKDIFYPKLSQFHHNEENYITKYIQLFGIDNLINKLNDNSISLPLLEYLNNIDSLNDSDIFNISEARYRELYHSDNNDPIDVEKYDEFLDSSFKNILANYNLGFYDLYIRKFLIGRDNITFNTNIYLNRKILYKSNFQNDNLDNWVPYKNGSVISSWMNNVRYLKRISNDHPNGSYRILDGSVINYMMTFNFVMDDPSVSRILSLGLVNSDFTGKVIYINMEYGNEHIAIRTLEDGVINENEDDIIPLDFTFQLRKIYTVKLIKNIQQYELYLYNTETDEEASFSIAESYLHERRILNNSDIPLDRLLIQGSIGIMYNNFQIRNISVMDQSLPPRSSLLIEQVPYTLSLPNIEHIIDKPSYIFMIQTNKDITDKYVVTYIDGIRVSYSLQTLLINYDEKYGLQNFFTLLIEKNIFLLQSREKIEVEFLDRNIVSLVVEYTYSSQDPVEASVVAINKSLDGRYAYLMDSNGDYILDSNGQCIMTYFVGSDLNKYRLFKNGRYMSKQYYTVTEDADNIYFNLNFHIEYPDIITIEYDSSGETEIFHKKQIHPSGICTVSEHSYPLAIDYYDFYLNGRRLNSDQIERLSEHTIRLKNVRTLYNFDIVEKHNIESTMINSYLNKNTVIDEYIESIPESELADSLEIDEIDENEFDNITGSFNIIKTLYGRLYDNYLKMNIVNASIQINGNLLTEYQTLQDRTGNIPIDATMDQIKEMPLDPILGTYVQND